MDADFEGAAGGAVRSLRFEHVVAAYRRSRWQLAAILAAGIALAAVLVAFYPLPRQAKVNLFTLSDLQITDYQDAEMERFLKIDAGLLMISFIDVMRERDLLRQLVLSHKMVEREAGESDAAFDLRVEEEMGRVTFIAPTPESARVGIRNWVLLFETADRQRGYTFLRGLIDSTNAAVRGRFLARYERFEQDYLRNRSQRQTDLTLRRTNLQADYDRSTAYRLARLDEQIALLKSTGNRTGQMMAQSDKFDPGNQISVVDTSKVAYVPGYEQLERNAQLIRSRAEKDFFIDGLIEVDQELRSIAQDPNIERSRAGLARVFTGRNTPFVAVRDDLSRTSFSALRSRLMAGIGIILLSLLAAAALLAGRAYGLARRQGA